jgi:signal transduction histidine kinase
MSVQNPASVHDHSDLTAELQASRVRIVEAADEARRRLERDLHDGAQQRFVSASMLLGLIRRQAHGHDPQLTDLLDRLAGELDAGLTELREPAHGTHPAVLTDRGLRTAVDALAARSPVPVYVEGDLEERPARSVESALYFAVAEALTNVAKYSSAGEASVSIGGTHDQAEVEVRDDGVGGADPAAGSGLRGLVDRLGALGGHLHFESPLGIGTTLRAIVPLDPHDPRADVSCGCCAEGQCQCAP